MTDLPPTSSDDRIVYRWDLDKTYLRTEFDTIRDLLRTAFESAGQKRTIPGAAPLLRELQATSPYGIYIVSGSPEQLRRVLEAKLRLDGVRWDSLTLKPQLQNILRGRFRFIKDQVYYKLGALLQTRTEMPGPIHEVMFGDDAEADATLLRRTISEHIAYERQGENIITWNEPDAEGGAGVDLAVFFECSPAVINDCQTYQAADHQRDHHR